MDLSSVAQLMKGELARMEGLRLAAKAIEELGSIENAAKEMTDKHLKVSTAVEAVQAELAKGRQELEDLKASAITLAEGTQLAVSNKLSAAEVRAKEIISLTQVESERLLAEARRSAVSTQTALQEDIDNLIGRKADAEAAAAEAAVKLSDLTEKIKVATQQLTAIRAAASKIIG